jgi:GT2 family glycosyltransferase
LLQDTVESVLKGEEVPAEIVIVDQSERAHPLFGSYPQARHAAIHYLWSSTRGLSAARNEGLAAAGHDIVVFLDDDMFVERDWFGRLVRALLVSGPNTVVTGRVLPAQAERRGGFTNSSKGRSLTGSGSFVPAQVLGTEPAVYKGRLDTDVLAGGHMAAYRDTLNAVGGFDERLGAGGTFPAAEDNDLGFRLLNAGYTIRYVPDAVVYHRAWRPARDYWRVRWAYGFGKGGFYTKHLHRGDTFMLRRMALDTGRRIRAFPGRLLADRRRAVGDIIYLLGMLRGVVQWLLTERGQS